MWELLTSPVRWHIRLRVFDSGLGLCRVSKVSGPRDPKEK